MIDLSGDSSGRARDDRGQGKKKRERLDDRQRQESRNGQSSRRLRLRGRK